MRTILSTLILATALTLTGCVDDAASGIESAAAELTTATDPAMNATTPISFEGTVPGQVVACPLVTCVGYVLVPGTTSEELDAPIDAVSLTMTWTSDNPLMETMRLGIGWGSGESEADMNWETVDGTSPLTLEAKGLAITKDDDPFVYAWVPCTLPMCLAIVALPQDFLIEGTITASTPPAGTNETTA